MIRSKNLSLFIVSFLLISCGDQQNRDNEKVESVTPIIANQGTLIEVGNIERGSKLYIQCRACHSLKENERISSNKPSKSGSMKSQIESLSLSNGYELGS